MSNVTQIVGYMVGLIIMALGLGLLFSIPVMWLWNGCLVGALTIAKPIGWLQAWGISILCRLLFNPSRSKRSD